MWFDVIYGCGHTGRVQIYGKSDEREKEAARYIYRLCPECLQKERDAANQAAAAKNSAAGLPTLTGSPKQIAWAEVIRQEIIDGLKEQLHLAETANPSLPAEHVKEYEEEKALCLIAMRSSAEKWFKESSAKVFINARDSWRKEWQREAEDILEKLRLEHNQKIAEGGNGATLHEGE
ncbi:hypothetical protein [Faecalibaculum rodentium]|uniref:hypothetical protein n=1 Tax=Faecalibaculum rodentium TaxID=1702221 RepID=UPI00266FA292|nr:hypothetical protein [Faecalibaculum rodentium]